MANRAKTPKWHDLTGKTYGNLEVLAYDHTENWSAYWRCKCLLCGRLCTVDGHSLKRGNTKSCGCGEVANRAKIAERLKAYHYDGTTVSALTAKKHEATTPQGLPVSHGVLVGKGG